jgi:hypothetical protein
MHRAASRATVRAARSIAIGVALLVAVATGACAQTARSATPAPPATSVFQHRAAQVARAWEASETARAWRNAFVPLAPLTTVGTDVGFTGATKEAFLDGRYAFAAPTWPTAPSHGRIAFDGGGSMSVPLQSAADAYAELAAHPAECPPAIEPSAPAPPDGAVTTGASAAPGSVGGNAGPSVGCVRLRIMHVELGSVTILTSRGNARVPAWLFTVDGLGAPIARVAVAPSAITVPPAQSGPGVRLPSIAGADSVVSVDGRTITFRISVGACEHGFEPLVYETATSVVVGGTDIPDPGVTACPAIGLVKPVVAHLSEPLGDRFVLNVVTGQPLVITAYPPTGPTS